LIKITYPKTENCPSSNDIPPKPAYKRGKETRDYMMNRRKNE